MWAVGRFRVEGPNCSFCSKRGALRAYYDPEQFKLTTARDRVSTYQWGGYFGEHHHCGVCGCGTHSALPSFGDGVVDHDKPNIIVNARLFEDFDLAAVPVRRTDGKAY